MGRCRNEIHISSFSNFIVRLIVIGYKNVGESIIILFLDKCDIEKVVFSMVVDCYKKDDFNLTKVFLDKNGVSELDFACWTHPHDDHSPGFDEIIKSYCGNKTRVFHPRFEFDDFDPGILAAECSRAKNVWEALVKLSSARPIENPLLQSIGVNVGLDNGFTIKIVDDYSEKDCRFDFLTPFKEYIEKYGYASCPKKLKNVNELSISFTISLDSYAFYFGGDVENKQIRLIGADEIKRMRWMKVPHHCSDGANLIVDLLNANLLDCAVSSVYTSRGLPVSSVQDVYKSKGRLFMTQSANATLQHGYGAVQFDYQFKNDKINVKPILYGNAYEYL
ncbi:hypothetical protein IE02_1894 [Fibrobacter succinogenes subsp. elongatus]|uniref:Metallo-beta-lactamase domain-containing protein n=2 Tax=Fibrobacter succinogenes TaxID=833 RepID=A0A380S6X4_FIBSU|nr:hypothetical protein IE02_1894 [Fibrobacter succinogenes subsp. elongatus]SUQ24488.1 hypothetical protein SAMN05661053_1894 [Fibrobacter succinogenes]